MFEQAVRELKHYIEFADSGRVPWPNAHGQHWRTESPFKDAVKAMLDQRSWLVRPQIGVSGYRLDLGVVHRTTW